MNILLADDHVILLEGLKQILATEFPEAFFGEAHDAVETLDQFPKRQWDLVVLDITMPGRDGLDLLKELKQTSPKLPVLVLSGHAENQYAVRALRAGAAGYLTKDKAIKELVFAVKKVQAGGKYITASVAEELVAALDISEAKAPHETLSDREYEVLHMIALGKTMTDIARDLSLSIKTVSTYRKRIAEKTGLKTDADVARYALEHKLVE